MEQKSDAYAEGFRARLQGKSVEDNPHVRLTEPWGRWAEGWLDQDQHLTQRDEALDSIGWFG